jgi:hypothetical protein
MYFLKSKEVFLSDRLKLFGISYLFLDTPEKNGFNASCVANGRCYRSGYSLCIVQTGGSRRKPFFAALFCFLMPYPISLLPGSRGAVLSKEYTAGSPAFYKTLPKTAYVPTSMEGKNGWIKDDSRVGKSAYWYNRA